VVCPNCFKNCHKSQEKLNAHLQLAKNGECEQRLPEPELMTDEQKDIFKKKFEGGTSEEDKWRGYYHTLFPDDLGWETVYPCGSPFIYLNHLSEFAP
jgi:hypothetical protein